MKVRLVKVQGGGTKPTVPPIVFEVPNSLFLLPSKKPTPRKEKVEFASQSYFDTGNFSYEISQC